MEATPSNKKTFVEIDSVDQKLYERRKSITAAASSVIDVIDVGITHIPTRPCTVHLKLQCSQFIHSDLIQALFWCTSTPACHNIVLSSLYISQNIKFVHYTSKIMIKKKPVDLVYLLHVFRNLSLDIIHRVVSSYKLGCFFLSFGGL